MLDPKIHNIVQVANEALLASSYAARVLNERRRIMHKDGNAAGQVESREKFVKLVGYDNEFIRVLEAYKRDTHHCRQSYIALQVATSAFLNKIRVDMESLKVINADRCYTEDKCLRRIDKVLDIVKRDFPAARHFPATQYSLAARRYTARRQSAKAKPKERKRDFLLRAFRKVLALG